jgi:membrane protease YdiL (CAAX protease family)
MAGYVEACQIMNPYDQDPRAPREASEQGGTESAKRQEQAQGEEPPQPWLRELQEQAAVFESRPYSHEKTYPPDLQITWSWPHFVVFIVFLIGLLLSVPFGLLAVYGPHRRMTPEQFQQFMLSKPQFSIGGTIVIYALVLFFLYVTLGLLRGRPFWSSLGWHKIPPRADGRPMHPAAYFFAGCALSLFVFGLTSVTSRPEKVPIDEVFKYKQTAALFVAMAILVAPLAEETVFRGYLYPMFARWFGVGPSIVLTGVLFGIMHGPQLGDAKSLIAIMSLVGIVLTLVRSRTGSVFASFLMHLGYNSLIGVSLFLATQGFTKMPPGK